LKTNYGQNNIIFVHGHTHDKSYEAKHFTNAIGRGKSAKSIRFETLVID